MHSLFGKNRQLVVLCALAALVLPVAVFGRIGVGIAPGKMEFSEPLKMGGVYSVYPPLSVINNGDESATFGASVEYLTDQKEMWPPKEWFTFVPSEFDLAPGQIQIVEVKIAIPLKAIPGDYFSFLEGHPVRVARVGAEGQSARINIAAAAKLNFAVAPANIFQALYYRAAYLLNAYAPWTYVVFGLLFAAAAIAVLRKYVSLNIGLKRKDEKDKGADSDAAGKQ